MAHPRPIWRFGLAAVLFPFVAAPLAAALAVAQPGPPPRSTKAPDRGRGLEAESGLVGADVDVVSHPDAAGGAYVHLRGRAAPASGAGLRAAGNRFLRDGAPFVPVGVTMIGALSPTNTGVAGIAARHLDDRAMGDAISWGANTIRFQVSQPGLDPQDRFDTAVYLDGVERAVTLARAQGLEVILSVQDQNLGGGSGHPQPSTATIRAWGTLTARFNGDPDVMYEMFNEPLNEPSPAGWAVWRDGGPPEGNQGDAAVGHQAVLDAIRRSGSTNVVLAEGAHVGQRLDGVPLLHDPLGQLAYAVHPHLNSVLRDPANWAPVFGDFARLFPVVATEWTVNSRSTFCMPEWGPGAAPLVEFLRQRDIGLFVWAFDVLHTVVLDFQHTPSSLDGFACGGPDAGAGELAKAQLPRFRAHASPCPPPASDRQALVLAVDVPRAGTYRLWNLARPSGRTRKGAPPAAPSLVQVDDRCPAAAWAPGGSAELSGVPGHRWSWRTGPAATFDLTPGRHTLRFLGAPGGVDLDQVILSAAPGCAPVLPTDNCPTT